MTQEGPGAVRRLRCRGANHWLTAALLVLPLLLGIAVFDDYGLGWDESPQRVLGRQAWRYVFQGDPTYLQNYNLPYGVAFELVLTGAEKLAPPGDTRPAFLVRHLLTFAVFWAASLCLFALTRWLLRSTAAGVAAAAGLFLSPRLFADAFVNSKDLPFLSFFVVAAWTLALYLRRPTHPRAVLHGAACACATDIRVVGLLLPALTLLALLAAWPGGPLRRRLATLLSFAAATAAFTVLLWPYLWNDPWHRLVAAFTRMAHYPWGGEVLFLGQFIHSSQAPWYYLPVWIGVTTPLSLLLAGVLGLAVTVRTSLSDEDRSRRALAVVLLAWLFLPPAAILALHSVLYDGWRQTYFLAPALVVVAVAGLQACWHAARRPTASPWLRTAAAAGLVGVALDMGATAAWMVRAHPYQNVYFNRLAGPRDQLGQRFDLDYWGLSCRRLLESVLARDPRPSVPVYTPEKVCEWNARLLPRGERDRMQFVGSADGADYVVTIHRWSGDSPPPGKEIDSVRVDGVRLGAVYLLRPQPSWSAAPARGIE
ncbi:MAG TPA: hypothetical protein VMX54_01555 [Vicinamibacteria bacterium]|nr:hypothetical protein [Vicinamibacteria bacterium]